MGHTHGYKFGFEKKNSGKESQYMFSHPETGPGQTENRGVTDYEETYYPIMDATTFRYLIYLVVSEGLDMRLMDVVTTYLYRSINTNVYMKIPEGFKLPKVMNSKPRSMYSIKLQRSLYGLKQYGRMWYNRLSLYLLKE